MLLHVMRNMWQNKYDGRWAWGETERGPKRSWMENVKTVSIEKLASERTVWGVWSTTLTTHKNGKIARLKNQYDPSVKAMLCEWLDAHRCVTCHHCIA